MLTSDDADAQQVECDFLDLLSSCSDEFSVKGGSNGVKGHLNSSLTSGLKLPGIVECPTSHPLVKSSLEGATRKLALPVQPKEPLSVNTVCRIADHYISSSSLDVIRFLFILLVGLAGFEENDQYREVHTSLLAKSHKATCPVSITERLLKLLPSSTESSSLLVRRIVKSKSKEYFHATKDVSYTTLRERNLGNTLSHL